MRFVFLLPLAACLDSDSKTFIDKLEGVQQRMHGRYTGVQAIEQAFVTGNVRQVRFEAATIAALEEPDALPQWQPYFANVRGAARELSRAEDVISAAKLSANLGRQCARCHQAIGAKVAFRGEPKPEPGGRLQRTMAAHQWGAMRMWEGLIAPSDERWLSGADALSRAPLSITAESSVLGIADDVSRVHLLAARAKKPLAQDERAELFGQLLATCGHCHAAIRD